jgi:hypothetical protein
MAPRKKTLPKEPILVRSHTLTPSTETILKRLSQDAGDYIGRSVSSSAVVRALAIYAGQQSPTWIRETLFPAIEKEIATGTRWGKSKVSNSKTNRK